MKLKLITEIEVNDKDKGRCSINCRYVEKIRGTYHCTLFDAEVDTGEDDEIGYGFNRAKECINSTIGGEK